MGTFADYRRCLGLFWRGIYFRLVFGRAIVRLAPPPLGGWWPVVKQKRLLCCPYSVAYWQREQTMWHTEIGQRYLKGAEARLFAETLWDQFARRNVPAFVRAMFVIQKYDQSLKTAAKENQRLSRGRANKGSKENKTTNRVHVNEQTAQIHQRSVQGHR